MSPNAGGWRGGCGVSANENSCTVHMDGAQINFGDLTTYLTYGAGILINGGLENRMVKKLKFSQEAKMS
jgi:hypothetical protein